MKSILTFFNQLRSAGYSEAEALMQCINAARTDLNVPAKTADELIGDHPASSSKKMLSKTEFLQHLQTSGIRGDEFLRLFKAFGDQNPNVPFAEKEIRSKIQLYGHLKNILPEGSREFDDVFEATASNYPLKVLGDH